MNRIDRCFADLKARGDKALVCFLTSGDPDFVTTEKLVERLAVSGADIVELGVPFSDPLADGPTIQASSFRALQAGASVRRVLASVRKIRERCDVPIVLMTYFNPVNKYGLEAFARDATAAGADGVIVTDLPVEEAGAWKIAADGCGLATIFLLAPTSTKERIKLTANMASGFIYCVSRTGVTGAQDQMPTELKSLVETIKTESKLPVVIGFGVSKPEHVRYVTEFADGAVVGSALVSVIADQTRPDNIVERAGVFVRELKGR
ncbi:MAG: tryptophan synthase subunit alpha [Armatimonadetes bacterium]|nr:tryptophan synthase subunit alpha [Armatimonadota bacterium]